MAQQFVSKRNLAFMLYEVHGVERLSSLSHCQDHTRETYKEWDCGDKPGAPDTRGLRILSGILHRWVRQIPLEGGRSPQTNL